MSRLCVYVRRICVHALWLFIISEQGCSVNIAPDKPLLGHIKPISGLIAPYTGLSCHIRLATGKPLGNTSATCGEAAIAMRIWFAVAGLATCKGLLGRALFPAGFIPDLPALNCFQRPRLYLVGSQHRKLGGLTIRLEGRQAGIGWVALFLTILVPVTHNAITTDSPRHKLANQYRNREQADNHWRILDNPGQD